MRIALGLALPLAGLTIGLMSAGCAKALGQSQETPPSTVELSVYRQDFGLISQRQRLDLKQGDNSVRLTQVSRQLDPESVIFRPAERVQVVGTTFDMGVGASGNAIQRLAGREVELILPSNDGKLGDRLSGTLEPTADGGFLLRTSDRVYINPPGTISAKDMGGVATMPGLAVSVQSEKAGDSTLDFSYLSRGLSWTADYIGHLDSEAGTLRLEAWASVMNTTGIPYPRAKVTLVAGSPNRAVSRQPQSMAAEMDKGNVSDAPMEYARNQPASAPVGELHEYPVEALATIGIDQVNRVRMFEARSVPVRLDYSVRLDPISAWQAPTGRVTAALAVHVKNRKEDGLGFPLPAGTVRVYDAGEEARYIGASEMIDLPKEAGTSLAMSKVFDVYAEPKVGPVKRIDRKTIERTLQVEARNSKSREIELRIVQPQYGGIKVIGGTKPTSVNGGLMEWKLTLPANSTRKLSAVVRMPG